MALRIDGYEIDVAIQLEHVLDAEVTRHPVEEGSTIADNVVAQPITLRIEGCVSNTPIGPIADARSAAGLLVDSSGARPVSTPAEDAFAHLRRVYEARQPVEVATPLRVYPNMVMQALTIPETVRDSLEFSCTFVEVVIVQNRRTTQRVTRAKGRKSRGFKAGVVILEGSVAGALTPAQQRRLLRTSETGKRTPIRSGGSSPLLTRTPIRSSDDDGRTLVRSGQTRDGRTLVSSGGS